MTRVMPFLGGLVVLGVIGLTAFVLSPAIGRAQEGTTTTLLPPTTTIPSTTTTLAPTTTWAPSTTTFPTTTIPPSTTTTTKAGPVPINNSDYSARAWFDSSDGRGLRIGMGEAVGGMDTPLYANLEVYDWSRGLFCFGVVHAEAISDYAFRSHGTHLTADIPVDCGGGLTKTVHVEVNWITGAPNIHVEANRVRDPMYGSNYAWVFWTSQPTIVAVNLVTDLDLLEEIPDLASASVFLWRAHGVTLPRLD